MESSPTVYPSASRARSEFVRETSLGFGRPDYRSSSIEIGRGRLNKRVINVTSLHSNDQVPLYLGGDYSRAATVVRDTLSPWPSPYVGTYRYQYGSTANLASSRYRSPSPV